MTMTDKINIIGIMVSVGMFILPYSLTKLVKWSSYKRFIKELIEYKNNFISRNPMWLGPICIGEEGVKTLNNFTDLNLKKAIRGSILEINWPACVYQDVYFIRNI